MASFFMVASAVSGVLSLAGHIQALIGSALLAKFRKTANVPTDDVTGASSKYPPPVTPLPWPDDTPLPGVTIMKPLHGDEPLLEEALKGLFQQNYPTYQIVFGLHSPTDPALEVVKRLQQRYPDHDVAIVIDTTQHGPNRKVGNLINMHPACRHGIIIISDSDIHVTQDYIGSVVTSLHQKDVQLVTTLYAGLPASLNVVRKLGAHSINVNFLLGVMISRLMGREDCLGATMALRQSHLEQVGGFAALVQHVADDAALGQLIRRHGGRIALAPTICQTTVAETQISELFTHELRWGRTVRSVEPLGYGLSVLQLPLFWGGLCVLFAPLSPYSWGILLGGVICRGWVTHFVSRLTNCALPGIFPLLILRDWMSALVMLGSARGSRVAWRGQTVHISRGKNLSKSL